MNLKRTTYEEVQWDSVDKPKPLGTAPSFRNVQARHLAAVVDYYFPPALKIGGGLLNHLSSLSQCCQN